MNCPKCQTDIPTTHINIASDIAQCPNCQNIFKISDNLGMQIDPIFDKNNPPACVAVKV